MAFKQTGIRATIKDYSSFIGKVKKMGSAQSLAMQKVRTQIEKQDAAYKKLGIRTEELTNKILKLLATKGIWAIETKKAIAQLEFLEKSEANLAVRTDILKDKLSDVTSTITKIKPALAAATAGLSLIANVISFGLDAWKSLFNIVSKVTKWIGSLFVNAVKKAISVVVDLGKKITSFLLSPLKRAADGIRDFFRRAAQVAVGILFAQTIRKMANALKGFIELAEVGAEQFQVLRIRLEGLVANELRAAGATDNFASALRMAIKPAADVLAWIQRLAVTTPFTRQDIGDTIAFSMAMGFTAGEAKTLTEAIGNFTAGMGLGTETMERIVLQFGQMTAAGKLLGTELRDLARGAFVPVNDILEQVAANTDMTATEWKELAARGETDIRPFFDEFIKLAQDRFPNAMERMNKTMQAVKQNISDFVTEFLGVKVLGPAVDRVSVQVSTALESLLSPKVMAAFEGLGRSVDGLVKKLLEVSGALAESVFGPGGIEHAAIQVAAFVSVVIDSITDALNIPTRELGNWIGDLKGIADDAFQWGANIMVSLAEGIIKGATVALQGAMKFVGYILSKWLKGSSPPKVAPNLPIWGKKALTEWLKGFALADFSVLTAIQGPLRGALDALAGAGRIGDAGKSFAKISSKMIEGFATGKPLSFFEGILKGTKEFKNELLALVSAQLAYKNALEAVAIIEERLEAARKKFADQTVEIRKLTNEYNDALRKGNKEELAGKLAEIQAAQRARNEAQEQIGIEEGNLESAKETLSAAEEKARLQDELLQQLISISQAQENVAKTAKSMADAASGAVEEIGESIDRAMGDFSAFESEIPGLAWMFERAKDDIQESMGKMFEPIVKRWKDDVAPALEELKQMFMDAFITLIPVEVEDEDVGGSAGEQIVMDVKDKLVQGEEELGQALGNALGQGFIRSGIGIDLQGELAETFGQGFTREGMMDVGEGIATDVSAGFIRGFRGVFSEGGGPASEAEPGMKAVFGGLIGNAIIDSFKKVKEWWETNKPLDVILNGFNSILTWWEEHGSEVTGAIGNVISAVSALSAQFSPGGVGAPAWADWTGATAQGPSTHTLYDSLTSLGTKFDEIKEKVTSFGVGIIGDLAYAIGIFAGSISPSYVTAFENMQSITDDVMSILGIGEGADGDTNTLRGILSAVNWLLETFGGWLVYITDNLLIITGAIDAIAKAFRGIAKALERMVAAQKAYGGGGGGAGFGDTTCAEGDTSCGSYNRAGVWHLNARGNWNVPYDNYKALLHRGEMVLPAHLASNIRASVTAMPQVPSSSSVSNSVNFTGDMNVGDGMDVAVLQHQIGRSVVRSINDG